MDTTNEPVARLYFAISDSAGPPFFTNYEHCLKCAEHNETMSNVDLTSLTGQEIGCIGWEPLSFLTAEALANFMPRLLEPALEGERDKHDEPVLFHMIFCLTPSTDFDRFMEYDKGKIGAVLGALEFARKEHKQELYVHNYLSGMDDPRHSCYEPFNPVFGGYAYALGGAQFLGQSAEDTWNIQCDCWLCYRYKSTSRYQGKGILLSLLE